MKKRLGIISIILAVCLLCMAFPVAAETAMDGVAVLLSQKAGTVVGSLGSAPSDDIDVTKQRVIKKDGVPVAEDHVFTDVAAKAATCNEGGWDAYKKCACGYETEHNVYPALGHSYAKTEYTWDADECTAMRVCTRCSFITEGNIEIETAEGVYVKDTDASCLECEMGHYEVEFVNEAFEKQSTAANSVDVGKPLGHSYGKAEYTWAADKCTATRVCTRCELATETETADGTYVKDTDAGCLECEKGHYEARFDNPAFEAQSTAANSVDVGKPLGHSFGKPDYRWDSDKCTATRVCTRCETETESETATGTYVLDTEVSCLECEKGHFKAEFVNPAFEAQTTEKNSVNIGKPLGHSYGKVEYTWVADECTARRDCTRCAEGTELETVAGAYVKDTDASCLECEKGHYEAEFVNEAFEKQSTAAGSVDVGKALGHSYAKTDYVWEGDKCTATRVCTLCADGTDGHIQTETADGIYVKDTDVSCLECEKGHYEAEFNNPAFEKQSTAANGVDVGEPLGHNYDKTDYVWEGDKCTATRVCTRCELGTVTETATGTYIKDSDVSCTECEKGHFEAEFNNPVFEKQSTAAGGTDVGKPLGHDYGKADYKWNGDRCTATRVCSRCSDGTDGHIRTETVTGKYVKDADANCLECEKGHHEAEFNDPAFEKQSTEESSVNIGKPLGHDYIRHEAKKASCTDIGWNEYLTCSRCDYSTYVEIQMLEHKYVATVTEPTCLEGGYTTHVCSECQDTYRGAYVDPLGHDIVHHDAKEPTCTANGWKAYDTCSRCDYSTFEKLDMLDHEYKDPVFKWNGHKCTATFTCVCGSTINIYCTVTPEITKEPTCTVDGEVTYTAIAAYDDVEYSYFMTEEIKATGHEYKTPKFNWTESFKCTGSMICKCGDAIAASCSLSSRVTKQASCSAEGERTYTATIVYSGESYTDTKTSPIAMTDHTPGAVQIENQVAATCTEPGRFDKVTYCTVCEAEISRRYETTEKLGHDLIHHEAKAPNCTDIGWYEYDTCSRCDYSNQVTIPADGHKFLTKKTEPTCDKKGYTTYTCRICPYSYDWDYVDELGHNFDEPEFVWASDHTTCVAKANCTRCGENKFPCTITASISIEPTCVDKGVRTYVASVSISGTLRSDIVNETVEATGHHYETTVIEPTCTRGGYTNYVCACGASKTADYVKATGHHHISVTTPPSCTEQGFTTHTCVCGDSYVDSYTDALGHKYKNGVCIRCKEGDPLIPAPKLTITNAASTGNISLKWGAVTAAEKYEIWRSTSKIGTYTKVYTTTKTSFINSSPNPGDTYYYKVRAINADGLSGSFCEPVVRTCDCPKPVVTASNNTTTGKCKLTWSKVEGASKYEIWRATSKTGTYTKMYTTTSTSYTNSTAKAGTTYYYKVKALSSVKSAADSAYSDIVSRTCDCPTVTVSKITLSSGHPKLTWSKVDGADKYIIYRATSKTGTYTKMYTTTSTSYTNSTAKAGTTYYYKVVAVSNKTTAANSAYSSPVSIKAK